jgi:hypothetical protein
MKLGVRNCAFGIDHPDVHIEEYQQEMLKDAKYEEKSQIDQDGKMKISAVCNSWPI